MKTKEILEKALNILQTAGWCQGFVATEKKTGQYIHKAVWNIPDEKAKDYTFCAVGAILMATKGDSDGCDNAENALAGEIPDGYSIASYNDSRGRTFAEMESLFKAAIDKA